jgi:hypothetical protein
MKWTRTGSLPRTAAGLWISIGLWDMMHDEVLAEVLSSVVVFGLREEIVYNLQRYSRTL